MTAKLAALRNYALVFMHKKVIGVAECLPRKSKLVNRKSLSQQSGQRGSEIECIVDVAIAAGELFAQTISYNVAR